MTYSVTRPVVERAAWVHPAILPVARMERGRALRGARDGFSLLPRSGAAPCAGNRKGWQCRHGRSCWRVGCRVGNPAAAPLR